MLFFKIFKKIYYNIRFCKNCSWKQNWIESSTVSSIIAEEVCDRSRPGIEPGLPAWEASTLEKSNLDNLHAGVAEPLLVMRLALQQQPLHIYNLHRCASVLIVNP